MMNTVHNCPDIAEHGAIELDKEQSTWLVPAGRESSLQAICVYFDTLDFEADLGEVGAHISTSFHV